MKFIDNFKENKELKEKLNTKYIEVLTLQAENDRQDIIIQELKEAIASVRKIWMDANNEKELKIVELNEKINELKRGGKSVSKSTKSSPKLLGKEQDNNK